MRISEKGGVAKHETMELEGKQFHLPTHAIDEVCD